MKLTLLEMVQSILSKMDSDEVTSINDTTEARQVAEVVRTAYFNIVARANLPEHTGMFSLEASGTDPVILTAPETVSRLDWIKYNKALAADPDDYAYVTILPFQQFTDRMHQLRDDATDVDTFTFNSQTFYYTNTKAPDFCTIIDDFYVIFDSLDIDEELLLTPAKTLCFGQIMPTFTIADSSTPDLDDQQFPLLLSEATSLAFLELKQIAHDHAVLESRRQWRVLQQSKDLNKPRYFDQLPNFGRK